MNCIFCEIAKKNIPSSFVYENDKIMAIMDINPISDGHVLIIPKEHFETIFDAPKDIIYNMYEVANLIKDAIMKVSNEKGVTLSINYGDKQEVKHLHMHIIPNFKLKAQRSYKEVYMKIMEELNEKKA